MSLAPLFAAPAVIQLHAFAALGAFALGVVQLSAPKGTIPHRLFGWVWAGLMLAVVVSSFFIHTIRLWGPWSPIHLLSLFTLIIGKRRGNPTVWSGCDGGGGGLPVSWEQLIEAVDRVAGDEVAAERLGGRQRARPG